MVFLPEVIAMKSWNTERSGYRSPIVADTEGNHSCGYPFIETVRKVWVSLSHGNNIHSIHFEQSCHSAGISR